MTGAATSRLELGDVQGGILSAYGKNGFPKARYLLFHVEHGAAGRAFLEALRPLVTTALRWPRDGRAPGPGEVAKPACTLNIAFSFWGLVALDVPTRTLRGMPDAFIDGMAGRAAALGDDVLDNVIARWDPVWQPGPGVPKPHILVMLNAAADANGQPVPALDRMTDLVLAVAARTEGKVWLMPGHRGAEQRWQELSAMWGERPDGSTGPLATEHFGFVDAIGDPVFEGQYPGREEWQKCVGQGAVDGEGRWRPLATGEFLLGWPDEAQEVAGAAMPLPFSRNGSFLAYRKLHQHLDRWDRWTEGQARALAAAWGIADPEQARTTLTAKMVGRWPDGVPLSIAPEWDGWQAFRALHRPGSREWVEAVTSFGFGDDVDGAKCPVGAHIRRANTRDMLDPLWDNPEPKKRMGSALNNRRRILRRGLPYGGRGDARDEHGIVLLAYCADLFRQFEFLQQQWMNYGLDFHAGNDKCPVVGAHGPGERFVIPAPDDRRPPFIAAGLPQFVSTRGGDYFFQPSMTALRMIGQQLVDPT